MGTCTSGCHQTPKVFPIKCRYIPCIARSVASINATETIDSNMHIITSDDKDFNDLLEVVRDGFVVGKSWHDGTEKIVYATRLLMVVFHGSEPDSIAVVPALNEIESHDLAL